MVEARSVNVKKTTTTTFQSTGEFVLKRTLAAEIQTPHGLFIGKSVQSKPSEHPRRPGELCRYIYLGIFRCSRGLTQNENDVYVKVVPSNHTETITKQFKACRGRAPHSVHNKHVLIHSLPSSRFKNEQFVSMAAAKRQSEHTCLLETSPSIEAANERVSLSELATQRLGSLNWVTSRDLEVGPLGNHSAGGTPGPKASDTSGDRGTTWRSYIVNIISGASASLSGTETDDPVFKAMESRFVSHFYIIV